MDNPLTRITGGSSARYSHGTTPVERIRQLLIAGRSPKTRSPSPELLASGGPEMQAQFMDELREIHLGRPARPAARPRVTERLASAYARLSPD